MLESEYKIAMGKMGTGAVLASATVVTLNDWVAVVTILYFVLQIGLLIPKYISAFKKRKNGQ